MLRATLSSSPGITDKPRACAQTKCDCWRWVPRPGESVLHQLSIVVSISTDGRCDRPGWVSVLPCSPAKHSPLSHQCQLPPGAGAQGGREGRTDRRKEVNSERRREAHGREGARQPLLPESASLETRPPVWPCLSVSN